MHMLHEWITSGTCSSSVSELQLNDLFVYKFSIYSIRREEETFYRWVNYITMISNITNIRLYLSEYANQFFYWLPHCPINRATSMFKPVRVTRNAAAHLIINCWWPTLQLHHKNQWKPMLLWQYQNTSLGKHRGEWMVKRWLQTQSYRCLYESKSKDSGEVEETWEWTCEWKCYLEKEVFWMTFADVCVRWWDTSCGSRWPCFALSTSTDY